MQQNCTLTHACFCKYFCQHQVDSAVAQMVQGPLQYNTKCIGSNRTLPPDLQGINLVVVIFTRSSCDQPCLSVWIGECKCVKYEKNLIWLTTPKDVWLVVWVPLNRRVFYQSPNVSGSLIPVSPTQQENTPVTPVQWAHLSAFCSDSNTQTMSALANGLYFFPFHLFFHTQFLINTESWVPEPDIEGCTLPFLKYKSDLFSNETHSFFPHFIIFPVV